MTEDQYGLPLTGADANQADSYNAVICDYLDYRLTAFPRLKALCAQAPEFAMAHLLKGFFLLSMGSRGTIAGADNCARQVSALAADLNPHEQLHLQALQAWVRGDAAAACGYWDQILFCHPRDLLALKLQHFSLFWLGRADHMRDAAARVLPAWSEDLPGYAQVLGMYAFGLEETGCYRQAEQIGRDAFERHPDDLWAVHAVAHVYEMQGRLQDGLKWLDYPLDHWDDRNPFKGHVWWHAAMFALDGGQIDRALELYDRAVRPADYNFYLDIQNTASLLARFEFAGVKVGDRWQELATAAENREGDHVLLFTEPHCAMVFGRTARFDLAERHIASLRQFSAVPDNPDSAAIDSLVLPLCRAIGDFYRGDHAAALNQLMALRYDYQPLGGSHAQRDVFALYLIDAACHAGRFELAFSLLNERLARRRNSFGGWQRYVEAAAQLQHSAAATQGRAEMQRIARLL